METKLYEDLKFCWKAGYKLNQIKEYCNTTLSIDELQTEFKIMWENELQCLKLVKVLDEISAEYFDITFSTIPLPNDEAIRYQIEADRVLLGRGGDTDGCVNISELFEGVSKEGRLEVLMALHKQKIADCFGVPRELLGEGDDNKQ